MAKRIAITERIKEKIRLVVDDDIDYDKISVYEATGASTRPIDQKHSAYHGAQMTESFLREMAAWLPEKTVTLQVMHEDHFLPVGNVFAAEVYDASEGHFDLNVLFYLESDSPHATKIDLAIIDEVSIGATPEHAYCSECGFDYVANPEAFWWRECEEGHVIGEDGCHLRLTKLDKWRELSLVNRGASSKAKILGSAKQRLGKEEYQRLAASGSNPDAVCLFACATHQPPTENLDNKETITMSEKALMELSATNGKLEGKNEALTAKLELSDSKLAEQVTLNEKLTTENAELKSNVNSEKVEKLEVELAAANEAVTSATKVIKGQYTLACTAAGIDQKEDISLTDMISTIEKAGVKLAAIPRSQQTQEHEQDQVLASASSRNAHFVTGR